MMDSIAKEKKELRENSDKSMISYIAEMIRITAKVLPFQFWINIPASLLHSLSFILIILASENFFNKILMLDGQDSVEIIVRGTFILGGTHLFNQIINGLHNYMYSIRSTQLIGIIRDKIHKKANSISPVAFEDPLFLDKLEKAKKGTEVSIFASDLVIVLLTFYVPYFIFMAIYLGSRSKILLSALLLVFAPVIAGQILRMKLFKAKEDLVAPLRREMQDREMAICGKEFFKETRLLGGFTYIQKLYYNVIDEMNAHSWKTEKRSMLQLLLLNSLTILGYLSILFMLLYLCINRQISIGSFVAVFSSLGTMFNLSEEIVSTHIGSIAKDAAHVQNLVNFLSTEEDEGRSGTFNSASGIKLKDVEFTYPGAKSPAIKGINLTINEGEVVAIVGDNGAGKSTLAKLITGIYKPSSGVVKIGGLDTNSNKSSDIYRGISAVFQKFNCYKMTLKDNIEISDNDIHFDRRENQLNKAICESELDMSSGIFKDGVNTMLSREFDGVDLSGGQWQRVAISRGLYRDSSIIVLDEPTNAIDPLEETRLYNQFAKMSAGKTTLIVTHRIGSTRIADRIIVMKNGLIHEIGTYEELMNLNGLYADMYNAQAKWYEK